MIKALLFLIFCLPLFSYAGLNDCGVSSQNVSVKELSSCKEKEKQTSAISSLDCYYSVYKNSLKRLASKSIYERSPLMRDLLSLHRQNYARTDEENKILDFYETTELYLETLDCATGKSKICESREDLAQLAKDSIPEAIKLQSYHHALKEASKAITELKKLTNPDQWPKGLKSKALRNDYTPQAIKDCQMNISPGRYPPPEKIISDRIKSTVTPINCPDFMGELSQSTCEPKSDPLTEQQNKLEKEILLKNLFYHSLLKQKQAVSAHLASIPLSQSTRHKILKKINNEFKQCSDLKVKKEDVAPIFDNKGSYFTEKNKKMAKAIKELTLLNQESAFIGRQFNKLKKEHHRRCFFSPLNENAPYYQLKVFKKDNQDTHCTKSSNEIRHYKENFVDPIASRISELRTSFPGLSVPLSGDDIGVRNTCFKGQLNNMYNNPLQYLLFGRFGFAYGQMDLDLAALEVQKDEHCGEPAWNLGEQFNLTQVPQVKELTLNQISINPQDSFPVFLKNVSSLKATSPKIDRRLEWIRTEVNKPITAKEITLAQQIEEKINKEITENFIKNIALACEDPTSYGEAMLPVDKISKSYFDGRHDQKEKELYCILRNKFLKNKKYKQDAYLAASIGIGVLGMTNPVASAIAFPIEVGIEYAQWQEHQKDQQVSLALSLLGLDDYDKINSSYEGLRNSEVALYAVLALNALGAAGDITEVATTSTKITKRMSKIKKLLTRPIDAKKERELVERIREISSSDLPDSSKRELLIEILERAKKDGLSGPLLTELYKDIAPLRSLAIKEYKKNIIELLKETDATELAPKILDLDDYYLLKNINRKLDRLSDHERKNFSDLLLRRQVCSVGEADDCIFLALSDFANRYSTHRSKQAKVFWKLYKNDPQFYTYLEQEIRKRGLAKQYEDLGKEIARIRGESPLPLHRGDNAHDLPDLSDLNLEELEGIHVQEVSFSDLSDLDNLSTRSSPSQPIGSIENISDPFSDMAKLRAEIFSIAEDFNKLPIRVKQLIPRAPPKEVPLDLSFLKTKEIKGQYINEFKIDQTNVRLLQEYERNLMSLRAGDTIKISSNGTYAPARTLEVGRYLGMGNATHVFEITLDNGKEAVLRLPGNVDILVNNPDPLRMIYKDRKIGPNGEFIDRPKELVTSKRVHRKMEDKGYIGYRQNRIYVNNAKKVQCKKSIAIKLLGPCYYTVKILDYDPNYRFTIAEKIDVKMDGKEFLEDDLTQTIMTQFYSMRMPAEDIADMTGTSAELIEKSIEKINRLHLVMKMAKENNVTDLHQGQFVWAKIPGSNKMDWILADW